MARKLTDQRAQGSAVLQRFAQRGVPPDLESALRDFRARHQALEAAARASDAARDARDAAFGKVSDADARLDAQIDALTAWLVGARLSRRGAPLAAFSRYAPSQLARLAYLQKVREVREIAAKVADAAAPPEVARALADCLGAAAGVERAVAEVSGPQAEYDLRRAARDAAAMDWSKAYGRLQRRARVAFEEEPATYRALFAPPEKIQRPVRRRVKGKATAA